MLLKYSEKGSAGLIRQSKLWGVGVHDTKKRTLDVELVAPNSHPPTHNLFEQVLGESGSCSV